MGANEFEDSVARGLTESFHRHLYDISNVEILPQLLDGHLIHHDPTDSNVQRTVHSVLLVVLDEGLDYGVDLKMLGTWDMSIDKCVLGAQLGVTHYLVEHCNLLLVCLAMLVEQVLDLQLPKLHLHPLINLRQIQDVLCRVLDHVSSERTSFPEGLIVPHNGAYLLLLGVSHINVVLEQSRQRYVVIVVCRKLLRVLDGLFNDSMCDLSIKHKLAD